MHPTLSRTEQILAELVAYPSVSADGNADVTAHVAQLLESAGARVRVLPDATGANANLFATLGPDRPGGVILSGHTDVVPVADQPWSRDPFALHAQDGRLYGRGSCDMKGFVAACVAMAPEFAQRALAVPVHFAFTHDEEVGCLGAQALTAWMQREGLRPAAAVIGEPSMMRVIDGHKGCFEYTTRVTGLEGHGSDPDRGVNAAEVAARIALHLAGLRAALRARAPADCPFAPPYTTLNIGRISGGVAHNVIPGAARLDWEMRPVQPGDAAFVKAELAALTAELEASMQAVHPGAGIATDTIAEVVGLAPAPDTAARRLVMALTGANTTGLVAFGTEAGLFQQAGIPSVICGPGDIAQAHTPDEFLARDQLDQCLEMLSALGARLEQGPI